MERHDGSGPLLAFILGGVLGAVLALLFAPRSGRESRTRLKKAIGQRRDNLARIRDRFARRSVEEDLDMEGGS